MKAIYTFQNNKIYRIDQDTSEPKVLSPAPSTEHVMVSADTVLKKITASIFLNTMESVDIKSNKELYNCMKNTIKKAKITTIETIFNRYMMIIDYQLFDSKCEICHNVVTKPIEVQDGAILLGVAMNNELVYRRVKTFDPMIEFATANQLPLGIMKTADSNYHFKINDISIYQDKFNGSGCNCHNSIYCTPYSANSCATITDVLTDYICVYSSAVAGIQFKDIDINFVPKTIDLKINLTMANLIVAYDDADIIATLQEVIKEKYEPTPKPPTPHVGPDEPGSLFPVGKEHRPSDGSFTPDENGWFDYYERCYATNPGALLVVEDITPDSIYRPERMIRKHLLLKDIPDIAVGEFVRYVEAHDESSAHGDTDYNVHEDHADYYISEYDDRSSHDELIDVTNDTIGALVDELEDTESEGDTNNNNSDDGINGDSTDGTLDGIHNGRDIDIDYSDISSYRGIPSAQDRGATLDNTDSASNRRRNMNGFEMVDINDILL